MKIKATINLGNYENVSIESSEQDTAKECIAEIKSAADLFRDQHVPAFVDRVFRVIP
ncbi:MAG: hypothetical protein GWP10_15895 [Nitrospiraceae bacterium]|nr:hypothetical protein [Nitrospiraceae bacterium]